MFLENIWAGFHTLLEPAILLQCFIGVFLGTAVGVLPGIGPLATISLLLPVTYYLEPVGAIILLAGIYYGALYGGSTASILLNLPGHAASVVTCLDGYPLAQQGRSGVALFLTAVASFVGGVIGIILLALFSPLIAHVGLLFGSAEYFSLMLLGLVGASAVSTGSPAKGYTMIAIGLFLGTIGTDVNSGVYRFTLGLAPLTDGINIVALAMGLFGVAEVMNNMRAVSTKSVSKMPLRSMVPTRADVREAIPAMLRGTGIGSILGALPGTGSAISSFMAYSLEKKVSRQPEKFGKGAIEGLTAPEAANNAAAQTAFVPTLSLGIPGDAVMALMLGALIIHGIQPGPRLITEQPELFWSLTVSFVVGNLMLLVLNIPLIKIWVSILKIPYQMLYPAILIFICLGVYSVNNNIFDILTVAVFGIAGYLFIQLRFEAAPLLLGFVLGPMMEENLRRALLVARGNPLTLIERPISGGILVVTVAVLIFPILKKYIKL